MGGEFAAPSLKRRLLLNSLKPLFRMGGEFAAPSLKLYSQKGDNVKYYLYGRRICRPLIEAREINYTKKNFKVWAANLPPPH